MDHAFSFRRFAYAVLAMVLVLSLGTVGFRWSIDESWLQSFYRSVVSSTLTGLDTTPKNNSARLITIFLVLAGISIFAYIGSLVVEAIARGVIGGLWAERRRRKAIEALREHYIICGFGRVGRRVAQELRHEGAPFVVLDYSPEAKEAAEEQKVLFIEGNGTDDDDLRSAGLERARGLVAASDDDSDNLYITLSARAANPELLIVARASNEDASKKLRLAGADRIVQPYQAAGRAMANLMLRPQVTAFVDVVTSASGTDLRFEEIEVSEACGQGGRTIRELDIRNQTGALIVALRKQDGTFDTTPTPEAMLEVGDVLIAAGTEEELRALERLFAPRETVAR
ncbi:MAG: potassium channel protein [Actinobacteria bacterium]|nr:MAG: potassium channel protein [Actinomycetota bacterium]